MRAPKEPEVSFLSEMPLLKNAEELTSVVGCLIAALWIDHARADPHPKGVTSPGRGRETPEENNLVKAT